MSVRVMVVGHQELVRSSLRAMLDSECGIEVTGTARDVTEAIEQLPRSKPDVVLLDVGITNASLVDDIRLLIGCGFRPPGRVLILASELGTHILEIHHVGAAGVLLKDAHPHHLRSALEIIAAGYSLFAPPVRRHMFQWCGMEKGEEHVESARLSNLSRREIDVLELLVRGRSNAEIAAALVLSLATVKSHVQQVLNKIGVRDRTQAVIYAYEVGFTRPGEIAAFPLL